MERLSAPFRIPPGTSNEDSTRRPPDGAASNLCPPEIASTFARRLLGCYRQGEANDHEAFILAVIAVLVTYPETVALEVTHPARGLPSRLKWLPSVAEIRAACAIELGRPTNRVRYGRPPPEQLALHHPDRPFVSAERRGQVFDTWQTVLRPQMLGAQKDAGAPYTDEERRLQAQAKLEDLQARRHDRFTIGEGLREKLAKYATGASSRDIAEGRYDRTVAENLARREPEPEGPGAPQERRPPAGSRR